ncbi:hypothetical protein ACYOEI_02205 [Singulisphaera rosea]
METVQNLIAVLAGFVGLLTAVLTLYGKYLDVKKGAAREAEPPPAQAPAMTPMVEPTRREPSPEIPSIPRHEPGPSFEELYVRPSAATLARSRDTVKAPATTLLVAGLLGIFFNLFLAGFGYVDRFVTPLTTDSQNQQAIERAVPREVGMQLAPAGPGARPGASEDATVLLSVGTLICLSVASASAAWAGYSMLRLQNYWLSVAGSFAIMAGGCACCLAGLPIGFWCLSILFKPEVAASFR